MTLEVVGHTGARAPAWVARAAERARAAQRGWAALGLRGRIEVLERLKRIILDDQDRIASLVARECGKTYAGAIIGEVFPVADLIAYFAKEAPRVLGREAIDIRHWRLMGRKSYMASPPIGTVGVVSPWNFPFFLSMGSVVMGLLAGNAVILKPSEVTPLTGELCGELCHRAGVPEDVLVVASGGGATGAAVVASVDKVFFIGSDATARKILAACAPRLTPCVMELGGNAPALVLEDAHLENAAKGVAWGAFFNAGQICASVQRVYVARPHFERFRDLLVGEAKALRLSDDRRATDVGALTCAMQMEVVSELVDDARRGGATVLTGGRRAPALKGLFYEPTVLTGVPQTARFAQDEVFGPACMVMPFDSEDDAVRLANDTRYGLTASVWTRDTARGARLAERIEAGSVTVNDHAVTAGMAETPWGGHKQSGFGLIHSRYGLLEFVSRRHIHVNKLPSVRLPWWFPESPRKEHGFKKLAYALAGDGPARRLKALAQAARALWPG